ncbi:MAG: glycosyltransferase [Candidatus Altiarchaeota archaeon]
MDKITVVLPTYNERENISPLIEEIDEVLKTCGLIGEIIVVDDASPDGTGDIVELISRRKKNTKAIKNKKREGLARSILAGIKASAGDTVLVMDSDGSHPPEVIPALVEGLGNADLCLASRYMPGGEMEAPRYKIELSRLLNKAIDLILGLEVKDSTGGFFAVKKDALTDIELEDVFTGYGEYFFRLLYKLKKEGKKIESMAFRYKLRRHGKTKTNVFLMGAKYLLAAIRLRLT